MTLKFDSVTLTHKFCLLFQNNFNERLHWRNPNMFLPKSHFDVILCVRINFHCLAQNLKYCRIINLLPSISSIREVFYFEQFVQCLLSEMLSKFLIHLISLCFEWMCCRLNTLFNVAKNWEWHVSQEVSNQLNSSQFFEFEKQILCLNSCFHHCYTIPKLLSSPTNRISHLFF